MGYGVQQDFLYTLYQCKHCGDWLNKKGYVDLSKNPKLKTSKGVYCSSCRLVGDRREVDKNNSKILKKKK